MDAHGWTIVFESRRRWECHEQALVLDALGIPHLIADGPRNAALLLVPAEQAGRARDELRLYAAENRRRPPKPGLTLHGYGLPGVAGYVLVLVAAFLVQGRVAFGVDWLEAGGLDGAAVRNGEWWRVITALTLHGDAGHLVANLFFGAFFGAFAGQFLGSGVAWATILLAAGAGNGLDLFLLPTTHRAIGASTAVFAALGLIAALMWRAEARRTPSWARRYAPLIGAGGAARLHRHRRRADRRGGAPHRLHRGHVRGRRLRRAAAAPGCSRRRSRRPPGSGTLAPAGRLLVAGRGRLARRLGLIHPSRYPAPAPEGR